MAKSNDLYFIIYKHTRVIRLTPAVYISQTWNKPKSLDLFMLQKIESCKILGQIIWNYFYKSKTPKYWQFHMIQSNMWKWSVNTRWVTKCNEVLSIFWWRMKWRMKLHIRRNLKVLPGFVLKLSLPVEAILISHSQSAHLGVGKPQLFVYLC